MKVRARVRINDLSNLGIELCGMIDRARNHVIKVEALLFAL